MQSVMSIRPLTGKKGFFDKYLIQKMKIHPSNEPFVCLTTNFPCFLTENFFFEETEWHMFFYKAVQLVYN